MPPRRSNNGLQNQRRSPDMNWIAGPMNWKGSMLSELICWIRDPIEWKVSEAHEWPQIDKLTNNHQIDQNTKIWLWKYQISEINPKVKQI